MRFGLSGLLSALVLYAGQARGAAVFEVGRVFVAARRYAMRQFRMSPVFTTAAVLTLALGIGGTTAIFTLSDDVMPRSLPVSDPARLYRIGDGGGPRPVERPASWRRRRCPAPAIRVRHQKINFAETVVIRGLLENTRSGR